jgi:uncharacterized protein YjgD (DUF1641 family)
MEELVAQTNGTQMQAQIDDVNRKLDLILEELAIQRQKRQAVEDLVTDLNMIGNDLFKATVDELDKAGVEVDTDQIKSLVFRILRNTETLNEFMQMAESMMDLVKDAGPIVTQIGLDSIKQMHELEQKGYFDFFRELLSIIDRVVTHFTVEDVRLLADNVVTILETVKNLTQPEVMQSVNNALNVYSKLDMENIEDYSMWKAFRELRTPEMQKGIVFIMTFLKNISNGVNNNQLNIKN